MIFTCQLTVPRPSWQDNINFLAFAQCCNVQIGLYWSMQVRHCNNSLKHTESCYYEELAEGFSHLVRNCQAERQVGHLMQIQGLIESLRRIKTSGSFAHRSSLTLQQAPQHSA